MKIVLIFQVLESFNNFFSVYGNFFSFVRWILQLACYISTFVHLTATATTAATSPGIAIRMKKKNLSLQHPWGNESQNKKETCKLLGAREKNKRTKFSFDSVCWEDGQSFLDDSHSKRKKANAFPVYFRLSGWYRCKMIASSQLLIKTLICWIPNELQLTHYLVVFNVTLEPRKLDENCLNSDNYGGLFLSLKLSRIISNCSFASIQST